jgi:hypothetical protein
MIVSSSTMKPQNTAACAAPRHRPPQQLPLPDHLRQLRLRLTTGMPPRVLQPLRGRLAAERQPLQPPQTPPRHRERDNGQPQADDHPQDHVQPPERFDQHRY